MIKKLLTILGVVLVMCIRLSAQDNLEVAFMPNGIPDNLNVCGDPDTLALRIRLINSTDTISNFEASWSLFKGISLEEILPASSPGITWNNPSNVNQPQLSLPDLHAGNTEIILWATIRANCSLSDTIRINNQLQVRDQWEFEYDKNGQPGLSENHTSVSYRDAISIPFFTLEISRPAEAHRVGDCFNREFTISNTSLDAYVDTLYYSNLQWAGAAVDDILINGQSIPFTSTPAGPNQVLIEAKIAGIVFELNELTGGQAGNGDQRFDAREKLVLTEVLCMQRCDISANSQHNIAWGCDGDLCNTNTISDFLSIGQGEANINISNTQNQDAGYCQTGFTTLEISNRGLEFDPGFGTMEDIDIAIGLGGTFQSSLSGYNITEIRIGSATIQNWSTVMSLDSLPELSADPDGPGGLEDLDGDGYFDDLAVDQTFELTAFFEFDCSIANTFAPADSCLNNFSTSLNARVDFTDACGERIQNLVSSFYRPTNGNSGFSSNSDTDASVEGDIFYVIHRENRAVRNFATTCPNGGVFIATVELPQGVSPVLNETRLVKNESSSFNLLSSSLNNGLLTLEFGGPLTQFLTGTYDLILAFEADCSAQPGPSNFPLTFEFSCPDCDCHHVWFCDDLPGPWLHVTSPPCAPSQELDCPDGMLTTDFSVERTTFGFVDNAFTIPFPEAQANKKVAISCDEIATTITAEVGDLLVNDSIGVFFTYENPDNSNSNEPLFLFINGTVSIFKNGVETLCTVDPNQVFFEGNGALKTAGITFGNCLQDNGLVLNPGDSIAFTGIWKLNENGPIPFQFREIPTFRGYAFALRNGQRQWCDSYGEDFTVAKTNTVLDFPNSNDFPEGCDPVNLDFKIVTVNNGFRDYFGDELRPSVKVDSLVMQFDTAIFSAFSDFTVEVAIPGHPIHGNAFYELAPLTDFPDGNYLAIFDTLNQTPVFNTASNAPFNFRINLTPKCQSSIGSSDGNNQYHFNTSLDFKDRYYASFIGDGSCLEERTETIDQNIAYENPPQVTFAPLSPTDFVLLGDTAVWTFQICNNSFVGSATGTWLSLESPNGAVEIVNASDITDPNAIENLFIYTYGVTGNNIFVLAEGLASASSQSALDDICNVIRVKGLVSVCGTSNLTAHAGWSCEIYDPNNWNPLDYPPCNQLSIPLTISTRDPFIEASVLTQPGNNLDICDTALMEIIVRNVDLGATFDLESTFSLPDGGIAFIPGSFELAYPSNNAYQAIGQDPDFEGVSNNRAIYKYPDFSNLNSYLANEGLQGFNPLMQTDSNEMKIRFRFVTDCNFENGSQIEFSFQGTKGCGGPSNFEAGESFPINVNAASLDPDKEFEITLDPTSRLNSADASKIRVIVNNTTGRPSEPTDKMVVLLPAGLFYQNGTSIGLQPGNWLPGDPDIQNRNGREELTWFIPSDLNQNEQAILEFEVGGVIFDCSASPMEINMMTLSEQKLFCAASLDTCKIDLASSTSDPIQLIEIGGEMDFQLSDLQASCMAQGESVGLSGILTAQGFEFDNQAVFFTIYEDLNQNHFPDPSERQERISSTTGIGTIHSFQLNTSIPFEELCSLRMLIDSANLLVCEVLDIALPEPDLVLSASSQSVCYNQTQMLTNLNNDPCENLSYNWIVDPFDPDIILTNADQAQPEVDITNINDQRTIQLISLVQRNGCSTSTRDTITIMVNQSPEIDLIPSVNIQIGDSIDLDAMISGVGPFQINWLPINAISGANLSNPTVYPNSDQLYTIEVTDANGCFAIDSVQVNVFAELNAEIDITDTLLCSGSAILSVNVTGGDGIAWQEDNANPQLNALDDYQSLQPTFLANVPGNYSFLGIVSDSNLPGVTDTVYLDITVAETPFAEAGRDAWVCQDATTQLNGSASRGTPPYTFEWSGGYLGPDPTVFVTQSDFFHLTVTDQNGCSSRDSVLLNAYKCPCDFPVVESTVEVHPDCNRDNGRILLNMKGKTSDFEFTWSPDVGTIIDENERTDLPVGIYDIRINRVGDPTCVIIYSVFLNPKGVPDITIDFDAASCGQNDGRIALTPLSYKFNWPDGMQAAERNDLAAGRYYVTVVDPNQIGCPYFLDLIVPGEVGHQTEVVVNDLPDCNSRNGSVSLVTTGGSGNYSYSWFGGQAQRDDLAEGLYLVTVTDNDNPDCQEEISFVLGSQSPTATVQITDTTAVSCAGREDGGVRFDVQINGGFSGTLDTIISNGLQNFQNDSLPPGNYCLEIRDSIGCIQAGACFEIKTPAPISVQLLSYPDCNTNGQIETRVQGGTAPYTFDWDDVPGIDNQMNRMNLAAGSYSVTVADSGTCAVAATVEVYGCDTCHIFGNLGQYYLQANCEGEAIFCIPDRTFGSDSLGFVINGAVFSGTTGFCERQEIDIYSFQNLFDQGNSGPYQLESWMVNGQSLSGVFTDLDSLSSLMNQIDPGGNWMYNASNLSIRGGNRASSYGSLVARQMAFNITSQHNPSRLLQESGYGIYLPVGDFSITVIDLISNCKDSVLVNVVCTVSDTIRLVQDIGMSDTVCVNGNQLFGVIDTVWLACGMPQNATVISINDSCFVFTGDIPGFDTTCLVACDSFGICDTTYIIIEVREPAGPSKIWRDTVLVGESVTICCDTSELNLSGAIESISNACPDLGGVAVDFQLDSNLFCVNYEGIMPGIDTACIVFCDGFGNCDTVPFIIQVTRQETLYDTIYLGVDTVTICLDTLSMDFTANSFFNNCPVANQPNVSFDLEADSLCITYSGLAIGVDTACLVIRDSAGNFINMNLIVTVINTERSVYCDTIYDGETIFYCPPTDELPGQEIVSIFNECMDLGEGNAEFFENNIFNCLEITGLSPGHDTACLVICDELGVCDTTTICITVEEYLDPPILQDDCDTTETLQPVVINVKENDIVFGTNACPTVIRNPLRGAIRINPDCTISYVPFEQFCDGADSFQYEICNGFGCDTAMVKVYVHCLDIMIFTAVSPNRDGINDVFYIGGLEDKPDNHLIIFNRWGNKVFEMENYDNSWDGSFNGKELPDGTYYYIFEVDDQGVMRTFNGYLEIFR